MKRLLFIGNSHTYVNDMPEIVKINAMEEIEVVMLARAGITFNDHLQDPSFHFMIKQTFDGVIIQQAAHSPCPSKEETLRDANKIIEEAKRFHQCVYVLVPWAHKGYDDIFTQMMDIYDQVVNENHIKGIYCGKVIQSLWHEMDLFYRDDEHLSPLGSYVEACCILNTVLHQKTFKALTITSGFNSTNFDVSGIDSLLNQKIETTIDRINK